MRIEKTLPPYRNRREAGLLLASALRHYRGRADAMVIGLPRGGVITAAALAAELDLPLDVLIVRKLRTPGHEELAMGAIAAGGTRVVNRDVVSALRISNEEFEAVVASERPELMRREARLREGRPPINFKDKAVIVVDDGLATGSTMEAAVSVINRAGAAKIVVAVPVAPRDTCARLRQRVDELVCLATPEPFEAVGLWYEDFAQITDDEVVDTLQQVWMTDMELATVS